MIHSHSRLLWQADTTRHIINAILQTWGTVATCSLFKGFELHMGTLCSCIGSFNTCKQKYTSLEVHELMFKITEFQKQVHIRKFISAVGHTAENIGRVNTQITAFSFLLSSPQQLTMRQLARIQCFLLKLTCGSSEGGLTECRKQRLHRNLRMIHGPSRTYRSAWRHCGPTWWILRKCHYPFHARKPWPNVLWKLHLTSCERTLKSGSPSQTKWKSSQ